MQTLRHTQHLARLALVWFVLSLGVATAAPLLQAQDYIMVCSSAGMYQLMLDGDEVNDQSATNRPGPALKCPLCMSLDAQPDLMGLARQPLALSAAPASMQMLATTPMAILCAAPLPARGPPGHLVHA